MASWSINQWRVQRSFPSLNWSRNPSQKDSGHWAILIQLAYHCYNCHISWSAAWWQWVQTTSVWRSKAGCLSEESQYSDQSYCPPLWIWKKTLWLCTLQLPTVSRDMNCMKIHTHVYIKDGPCPQSTYNLNQQISTAFYTNCHLLSP